VGRPGGSGCAGAGDIGTHHLLVGLFEEGVAAAILEKLGVRADAARAVARELFPGSGQPGEVPPPESAEARDAICGAEALARRGGCGYVGTEHLLGALALDPGSRARRVLASLGVSIPAIMKELECYISPGRQRRRRRGKAMARGVLVLRQAGRGRAAAGRRAGRAHLRRVHRAVQRDPRRGLGRRYRRGWSASVAAPGWSASCSHVSSAGLIGPTGAEREFYLSMGYRGRHAGGLMRKALPRPRERIARQPRPVRPLP
jgi:hypothetical protein